MSDSPRRVGRPRRAETGIAILDAASRLLRERGYAGVTMEAVAATAGVAKTTVYRRWPNRGALLVDVYLYGFPEDEVPIEEGSPRMALIREIGFTLERLSDPLWAATLRSLVAEAQADDAVAAALRDRIVVPGRERVRAILDRAEVDDPEAIIDALFGAIWCRLLLNHAPMDRAFIGRLARALL